MVNPESKAFGSEQILEYDQEGRMLVYDGLAKNLKKNMGFFSITSSVAGLIAFKTTPASYAMDLNALMHWGGITWFSMIGLLHLWDVRNRHLKINRVYLLQGGQVARLQFNSGKSSDVPVSGLV